MPRSGEKGSKGKVEKASSPAEILSASAEAPIHPAFMSSRSNKFFMIVFNGVEDAKIRINKMTDIKELEELKLFAYRKDKVKIIKIIDARLAALKSD